MAIASVKQLWFVKESVLSGSNTHSLNYRNSSIIVNLMDSEDANRRSGPAM